MLAGDVRTTNSLLIVRIGLLYAEFWFFVSGLRNMKSSFTLFELLGSAWLEINVTGENGYGM